MPSRHLYISFDRFPSAKGAATHIEQFATALGQHLPNLDLISLPPQIQELNSIATNGSAMASDLYVENRQCWTSSGVNHHSLPADGNHLFERVRHFRTQLWRWWQDNFGSDRAQTVHFRSIFEGYPIARNKKHFCNFIVYEVNGFPSIELKYHYPAVADDQALIAKIKRQEDVCLKSADAIITVSQVNKRYIQSRGIPEDRIHVIPNGVDLSTFAPPEQKQPLPKNNSRPLELLYAGGLTSWQGVGHAIEALALLRRDIDARLTLVGPTRPRHSKPLVKLAWSLGLMEHVEFLPPVSKPHLAKLHQQTDIVLAPLKLNDRNDVQGCCPLKILEAMACQCRIVSTELEVVRELATHESHAILVRPNSSKAIKDGCLDILKNPENSDRIALLASQHVRNHFDWKQSVRKLKHVYDSLLHAS